MKTDGGKIKGKISFYCKVLHVSRQASNKYLKAKNAPWKYQALADAMTGICSGDNAMTLMEESVCIRHYSPNSLEESAFLV